MMRAFENCGNPIFAPDGKGQITVEYSDEDVPLRVATVLMSNAIDYRRVADNERASVEPQARHIAMGCLRWLGR